MNRRLAKGVLGLVVFCLSADHAWAQRAAGPYAGLFGGQSAPDGQQTLAIRWQAYGGYSDVSLDQSATLMGDNRFQTSGDYGGLSGTLAYQVRKARGQIGLSGTTSYRLSGSGQTVSSPAHSGQALLGWSLTKRTSVQASVGASYSSFYQFVPFLGIVSEAGLQPATAGTPYGLATVPESVLSTFESLSINQRLTSRGTLSASVGWSRAMFGDRRLNGSTGRSAGFSYRQAVSKALHFHVGYNRRNGGFRIGEGGFRIPDGVLPGLQGTIPDLQLHDWDFGLDFNKGFSFAFAKRKSTVSFASGSTVVQQGGRSIFALTGNATFAQSLGRTWSAGLTVSRQVQVEDIFRNVVFSNGLTAGVSGQLATRVQLSTSVRGSLGKIGMEKAGNGYGSYTASTKVSVAASRLIGVFAEHTYYHYNVPSGSTPFLTLAPTFSRQAVMIGVSGWIPLINDTRSRRDSR